MNNKLNTIGLCKRAGKLIVGFDAVIADIAKSSGVLMASDLSEKSSKEVIFHFTKHNKPFCVIEHTMDEIEKVIGKKSGILSILDEGFYKSLSTNKESK